MGCCDGGCICGDATVGATATGVTEGGIDAEGTPETATAPTFTAAAAAAAAAAAVAAAELPVLRLMTSTPCDARHRSAPDISSVAASEYPCDRRMSPMCARYCDMRAGSEAGRAGFTFRVRLREPPVDSGRTNGLLVADLEQEEKGELVGIQMLRHNKQVANGSYGTSGEKNRELSFLLRWP